MNNNFSELTMWMSLGGIEISRLYKGVFVHDSVGAIRHPTRLNIKKIIELCQMIISFSFQKEHSKYLRSS